MIREITLKSYRRDNASTNTITNGDVLNLPGSDPGYHTQVARPCLPVTLDAPNQNFVSQTARLTLISPPPLLQVLTVSPGESGFWGAGGGGGGEHNWW